MTMGQDVNTKKHKPGKRHRCWQTLRPTLPLAMAQAGGGDRQREGTAIAPMEGGATQGSHHQDTLLYREPGGQGWAWHSSAPVLATRLCNQSPARTVLPVTSLDNPTDHLRALATRPSAQPGPRSQATGLSHICAKPTAARTRKPVQGAPSRPAGVCRTVQACRLAARVPTKLPGCTLTSWRRKLSPGSVASGGPSVASRQPAPYLLQTPVLGSAPPTLALLFL